jgi:glycosyltransferase involved in cell wall biosynthesis
MARNLLILHDSADFGGHERMFLHLLPALLTEEAGFRVTLRFPAANRRLRASLEGYTDRLHVIGWPFAKRRGDPYLWRARWRYRAAIRRAIAEDRPDTVLLLQGRIENLAVPMGAIPRDVRLVSYLPMAHRLADMGRAAIGDRARRPLYRRPDHFVVPSEVVTEQIRAAGGIAPVTVAPNVVTPPPRSDRAAARRVLGLPGTRRIALLLGRLESGQKGIDRLLAALARAGPDALPDWLFLFVGDGPARPLIERLAARAPERFRVVPWTERPNLFLSAADSLLLPSRWEGLPLTMLEAMAYGLPILASDLAIFRLYLPPAHSVDFETVDLGEALPRLVEADAVAGFARHAAARLAPFTLENARRRFVAALSSGHG